MADDAGDAIISRHGERGQETPQPGAALDAGDSPGLWALISIVVIGAFNLMGPKHTAGFAVFAAAGMVAITLLVVVCAVPQIALAAPRVWAARSTPPLEMWEAFVSIVLALSGRRSDRQSDRRHAQAGLQRPPARASGSSRWKWRSSTCSWPSHDRHLPASRHGHTEDMLAFMAQHYVGRAGANGRCASSAGLLLLSATNTAVNGLMSIIYVMWRDGELPGVLQKLNGFGAPWVGAIVAAGVPALVLLFAHDLETLASLYAIGVVGAVAINITLCSFHPRLRGWWRKVPMLALGLLLVAIEITLAFTKLHALIFVSIVLAVGLTLRQITRYAAPRRPKPSLLRQAIVEQLPPDAWRGPSCLLATAGSAQMADPRLRGRPARERGAGRLLRPRGRRSRTRSRPKASSPLTPTPPPRRCSANSSRMGHRFGVPIIPMYDTGPDAAELIAEVAAMNGVEKVLIGTSRRGALHQLIKGSFQATLESPLAAGHRR